MLANSRCDILLELELRHIASEELRASKSQAATFIRRMFHQAELNILWIWVTSNHTVVRTKQRLSSSCDEVRIFFEEVFSVRAMLEDDADSIIGGIVDHGQERALVDSIGNSSKRLALVPMQNPDNSQIFSIFKSGKCSLDDSPLKRIAWTVLDNLVAFRCGRGCDGSPAEGGLSAWSVVSLRSVGKGLTRDSWTHEEGINVPGSCAVVEGLDHVVGLLGHDICRFVLALLAKLEEISTILKRRTVVLACSTTRSR
jgi:hypothetical protein